MKSKGLSCSLLFSAVILLAYLILSYIHREKTYTVNVERLRIDSLSQILELNDSLIKPVIYSNISGLENLPVPEIKSKFIAVVLPSILIAKHHVEQDKLKLERLASKTNWKEEDSLFYYAKIKRYKASDLPMLIEKMGSLPNSIVLAQAALESGWGQSRFFQEANNIFGIWSYREDEPRIRALQSRNKRFIYLRAYDDIAHSIIDYLETINSAKAYHSLRKTRMETTDPYELIPHLRYYSEQRTAYVRKLKLVISKNKLTQYDHYRIHPDYLIEE